MSTDSNMNAARYRNALLGLALAAAIATVFLISLGSFVRVTGSGLACPDWPLCHGSIIPPFEYHVLIEYSHRLTASIVGLLIAAMFVVAFLAFRKGEEPTRRAVVPAAVTLVVMLTQAGLGGVAVVTELPPPIVTLHLFLAEAILALLIVTMLSATSRSSTPGAGRVSARDARKLYLWAVVAAVAMLVMILSGSYVVAEEATLACGSGFSAWPLCDGAIMPSGFDPSIHMGHRFMVVIGTGITGFVAYLAWRQKANDRMISRVGQATLHLLIIQIIIGALVPWTEFHHAARVAHITLASITWAAAVLLVILAARARANAGERGEDVEGGRATQIPPAPAGGSGAAPTMTLLDMASDYFWLTKPRVMVLLLLTALGGMVWRLRDLPSASIAVAVLLGGALASGGAGAINHGLEANIDAAMLRTRHRPVASGRVAPRMAISYGIALNVLAFVVLAGGANVLAASITLSASLFYVFVYTLWLKQTTVQNIVIGGAAGAVPPLVGWAAVTGDLSLPAIYLFLIIFFWTPPHFWALSIMIKDDYERASVPMMPVILGEESTRTSIFLYTILVNILALLLYISTPLLSAAYLAGALVLGGLFTYYAYRLLKEKDRAAALRLYKFSLLYLSLLFLVIMIDQLV